MIPRRMSLLPEFALLLLVLLVAGSIQLTEAIAQPLSIRPNTLATMCAQNSSVDIRFEALISAPGADGVFVMKRTDLDTYKRLIAAGNTTAKVVGYSGLSCDQPAVTNCTRGTSARQKIIERNIYPCLVIRNRGRTTLQAQVSIEFDATTPLSNSLAAGPQGGNSAAAGVMSPGGTTATSAQAGKEAEGTGDFFSSSAVNSIVTPGGLTTSATLLMTWLVAGVDL